VTNSIYAIVVALATASLGGIFSSTSPDMGSQVSILLWMYECNNEVAFVQGILDRFAQIEPKFLFAESDFVYAGKQIAASDKVITVVKGLRNHGLEHTILLPSADGKIPDARTVPDA
jgi:acetoacetyl-CoA synthetase